METEPLMIRAVRGSQDVAACALGEEPVTIGSWAGASLRLEGDELLPVEVVLDPDGPGRLRLLALGADGCEVNGRRARRAWVKPGDTLGVGPFVVRVCGSEATQTAPPLVVEVASNRTREEPLRATLLWQNTRLDVRQIAPGGMVTLGGRDATFDVPFSGRRVPVVACLDGLWHVALDADCRAFDVTGDAPRPLLCAHPRRDGPTAGKEKGGLWAPFPEGARLRLEAGDVFIELERGQAFAKERIERTPWWITGEGQAAIIGAMFACLIFAMLKNPPPAPFTGVTGERVADLRAPPALPRAVVKLKETFKPIRKKGEPSKAAAKAAGKEGRAGRPDAEGKGRRTGPLSDEEVVKRSELFKALGALDGATSKLMGGGALSAATSLGNLGGTTPGDGQGNLGLGLRGTGSGGGGLSADSVGVGPVNTKGVGEVGSGSLEGGTASELGIDEPGTVAGGLDREVIRRVILSHRAQIRYCYEKQLAQQPGLAGKLLVEFVIGADGRVTTARAAEDSLGDAAVGRCIVSRVKGWTFPKPKGGGVVVVTYPFLFKPAGQGAR